jgi:integrase
MALRKRGGIWYFRKMINGRLFRESTGFADRKAAERRANEIELDIRAGVHGWKSTIPSFAEWWDVYRKTYTPLKSARNRDVQIVAHFLPHFGARRLDEITKSDIVRYLNLRRTQMTGNPGHKKRRLVSDSTVRRERGLLQSIFERAIDEGHDIRNPFRGIKRGKDKPRTRVLTLDEETLLLEALHTRFQRFVRFAPGTGCRLDEIRGIAPERDVDWIRGTVHVIGKFRKERDVPMQPDARASLEEQLEEEGKLWKQNPQRLREVLAEGSARAKIPSITPHVLRHYAASRTMPSDVRHQLRSGPMTAENDSRSGHALGIVSSHLQTVEEAKKLIARSISSRPAMQRWCSGERLLLHGESGLQIDLRVSTDSCPSQSAITERSTPARSRSRAMV